MIGIGLAVSRLSSTRAFLAGAAILAGAVAPSALAQDSGEDTALAVPRVSPHGMSGATLPQPLTPSEALRIRRIFGHQARMDIPASVAETARVGDPMLLGHILADRYLGPSGSLPNPATAKELSDWLARYGDLPDTPAIHSLLLTLIPKGDPSPPAPARVATLATPAPVPGVGGVERFEPPLKRNPVLDRSVHEPARAGQADRAIRLISRTRGLDAQYGALLRAEVAQILFTQGRDAEALSLAGAADRQARGQVGLAPYIGGLAAWRLDRVDQARTLFEAAYRAPLTPTNRRAASAFWAARAHQRGSDTKGYAPWMAWAAEHPMEFYGLLARRTLGWASGSRELPEGTLGEADVEAVADTPSGNRAFALLQVGQTARADAELLQLFATTRDRPGFGRSILLVARAAGLTELSARLAPVLQPQGVAVRLPSSRLTPAGGFRVDPALIYGIARVESNFDAAAVSPAGAQGLMQIMPLTADHIMRGSKPGPEAVRLDDPATNLDLGQRYLLEIAQYESVRSDLIRLLASYNAGPGSHARWGSAIRHRGDPLLFIESVPIDETRAYVQRTLAYTWLYAAKFRLPTPSLDELAAGVWPRFTPGAPRKDGTRLH